MGTPSDDGLKLCGTEDAAEIRLKQQKGVGETEEVVAEI